MVPPAWGWGRAACGELVVAQIFCLAVSTDFVCSGSVRRIYLTMELKLNVVSQRRSRRGGGTVHLGSRFSCGVAIVEVYRAPYVLYRRWIPVHHWNNPPGICTAQSVEIHVDRLIGSAHKLSPNCVTRRNSLQFTTATTIDLIFLSRGNMQRASWLLGKQRSLFYKSHRIEMSKSLMVAGDKAIIVNAFWKCAAMTKNQEKWMWSKTWCNILAEQQPHLIAQLAGKLNAATFHAALKSDKKINTNIEIHTSTNETGIMHHFYPPTVNRNSEKRPVIFPIFPHTWKKSHTQWERAGMRLSTFNESVIEIQFYKIRMITGRDKKQ